MPPTTPHAGKFNSCPPYSNNNHPQPQSPYRSHTAPKPSRENVYNGAYSVAENPYDVPQPHAAYRSCSVSSVNANEHHYSSSCAISGNPYSLPQPQSPRQHSTSCPGRAYRHTSNCSSSSSSDQSCRNSGSSAKARLCGHSITASYGEMCYHDNSLVSASLEALIQHLVPTVDYYPDRSYVFTFLLSSRLFLHPYELMTRVCHLCVEQQRSGDALLDKDRLSFIGPEEFIQSFAMKDPLENHKATFGGRARPVETTRPGENQREADGNEQKQQQTHTVEARGCGFFRKRKTSNLEAYVNWFNRLSFLVATEICMPVKKKHRARIIEFFIDVAQECFNIGNFNSLMAIITGMNMSPVARLKKTWNKVNTDKFEILEHQMDPSSNFSNYRTALRGATQRSETAHSSQEKIVIPFFSLLIKDIYFLNEGCANRLPNGHINFEKLWELAKQVSEFLVWRQVICPFDRDRRILQYLVTTPVFTEDELHLASYESEGPENNMEKDSRRSLRSSLLHRENRS
uniref:RasGEF domain family, member 1Bb n=1 Tax=Nothobranchius furzeri TaxID=105023 RepID=A0A8C6PLP2_NOTFU